MKSVPSNEPLHIAQSSPETIVNVRMEHASALQWVADDFPIYDDSETRAVATKVEQLELANVRQDIRYDEC